MKCKIEKEVLKCVWRKVKLINFRKKGKIIKCGTKL